MENSGDVIAPVFRLSEQESSVNVIINVHAKNNQSLFSRTLEFKHWHRLANELNGSTFDCCSLMSSMLMKREVLNTVRFDEELKRTSYREETAFQLKAVRKGFRLLACPKVCILVFSNLYDKGGCSHSMNLFSRELDICRNNWLFLVQHKDDLNNFLGNPYPIEVIQALFIIKHLCRRLPISVGSSLIKSIRKHRIEK